MITYEDLSGSLERVAQYERYFSALCPFHSDTTPSLLVYRDGWWLCLGCQRKGRWDSLWRKLKGASPIVQPEVYTHWTPPNPNKMPMEELAYQASEDLLHFPSYAWYLEMRRVAGRVEMCQLGYWHGWYTVPVYNREGEFENVIFRASPHVQEATGHRFYYRGKGSVYAPNWHRVDSAKVVFFVFGIFDALTLDEMGYAVLSPVTGDHFNSRWVEDIRKPIIFVPDRGKAPVVSSLISRLDWRGKLLSLDYTDKMKDPNDLWVGGKEDYLRSALAGAAA